MKNSMEHESPFATDKGLQSFPTLIRQFGQSFLVRDVSATQIPQLQEVARVLKHMATIASSDQSSTPVIDFEEDEKKLHITDPFFAFYLRWGNLIST